MGIPSGSTFIPYVTNEITLKATRHVRSAFDKIVIDEGRGPSEATIEADDGYLRIGCTSISYEAFKKIAEWWEQTRKSNVRRMQ